MSRDTVAELLSIVRHAYASGYRDGNSTPQVPNMEALYAYSEAHSIDYVNAREQNPRHPLALIVAALKGSQPWAPGAWIAQSADQPLRVRPVGPAMMDLMASGRSFSTSQVACLIDERQWIERPAYDALAARVKELTELLDDIATVDLSTSDPLEAAKYMQHKARVALALQEADRG